MITCIFVIQMNLSLLGSIVAIQNTIRKAIFNRLFKKVYWDFQDNVDAVYYNYIVPRYWYWILSYLKFYNWWWTLLIHQHFFWLFAKLKQLIKVITFNWPDSNFIFITIKITLSSCLTGFSTKDLALVWLTFYVS